MFWTTSLSKWSRCPKCKFSQTTRSLNQLLKSYKLVFSEFGEPVSVLRKEETTIESVSPGNVLVKMLASPINPVDINIIQGKYPLKPKFPAIAGYEGVGEIILVGEGVQGLQKGDWVITLNSGLGTWRTFLEVTLNDLLKVPNDIGVAQAATLSVNPTLAYRMLKDYVNLQPGDTVIQNGANSACGQNIIEICQAWGVKTVNVVRNRQNLSDLVQFLKALGATKVLTEEEVRGTNIFKDGELKKPKLALNCIGGKNALEILRHLDEDGRMVTYGGMSKEPVFAPTASLIFKNINLCGFYLTKWSRDHDRSRERFDMFEELFSLIRNDKLHAPTYEFVKFDDYKEALSNTMTSTGMIGKKYILKFD